MQAKNEVSIIIVNYNKYQLTKKCVDSVKKNIENINYEIIIMDNCSTNNSYAILKNEYKDVENIRVYKNKINSGFGDGNNKAVRESIYRNILLLNPDVIVLNNGIKLMLDRLYRDSEVGIVGCKLLNKDLSLQYSCRLFISFHKFIIARTPLNKLFARTLIDKINSEYLMKDYEHDIEMEVDWIMGSCLLLKKKLFEDVNGFTKEYFMYFEDVDLCYKIRNISKKVIYFPDVEMIHAHEQQSTKKINKLTFIHLESMIKFYIKYRKGNN